MYKNNFNRNFNPHFNKNTPRKNQYIYANEIQLITDQGENLGTRSKEEGLKMAQEKGLDLIEINPNSKPPICKIMDYSKYMYDKKKKQKTHKARDMKELRFSPVIEQHDIDVRVSRAEKFLKKGHNVKLTIFRKGRQTPEQAKEIMAKLLTIFADYSTIESEPKTEGRKLYITIKADGKTKDKKNSDKEDKGDKSEGQEEKQDALQEERSAPSKDKIIKKIKEKKVTKGSS